MGATEDRVCGALDFERALTEGVKAFEPGLLAKAHRGFLYIDEVNLLEDHLVDLLLDVAASGWNVVEREGVSVRHPSRFVLVGSGNPEEGELRPQLLDRFGLYARIVTITDIAARMEIVRRREDFERDPAAFRSEFASAQANLRRRLARARRLRPEATVSGEMLSLVAQLCLHLGVDGHRGELTIVRAAKALAAWEGRRQVEAGDLRRVAPISLWHRLQQGAAGDVDPAVLIEAGLDRFLPLTGPEAISSAHRPRVA